MCVITYSFKHPPPDWLMGLIVSIVIAIIWWFWSGLQSTSYLRHHNNNDSSDTAITYLGRSKFDPLMLYVSCHFGLCF